MSLRHILLVAPVLLLPGIVAQAGEGAGTIPIIYTTDLYHPHQDPDDHFDLATLFALPEFDIRAIVIDMGAEGVGRPGLVPIQQMMQLTGRTVPHATGLTVNLESPEDAAENQPPDAQGGVDLILTALRESASPVTVFTTGSLRDVAAAYNRAPDLFKEKVSRLYVNAGHAAGQDEWNVGLDPHAYVQILRSPLPVYWVPCFGEMGFESLWKFKHGEVLDAAPQPLQNFFLYMLTKADPKTVDPLAALAKPVDEPTKAQFWDKERNMWCTAAFLHAAGRTDGPFRFQLTRMQIAEDGKTTLAAGNEGIAIQTFRQEAPIAYLVYMRGALRDLFAGIRLAPGAEADAHGGHSERGSSDPDPAQ